MSELEFVLKQLEKYIKLGDEFAVMMLLERLQLLGGSYVVEGRKIVVSVGNC